MMMPYVLVEASDEYMVGKQDLWGGPELIALDVSNPQKFETVEQFSEDCDESIKYKVRVQIEKDDDETNYIHIEYKKEDNDHLFDTPDIDKDTLVWGTHILIVKAGESFGESRWIVKGVDQKGPGWRQEQTIGERRKVTTTVLQRDQAKFRKMMLSKYGHCAVTRESCREVLEAAHIVAVKDGGQEVISNGILLRADLHKLFDADPPRFEICSQTGKIQVDKDFRYGSFDLNSAQIERELLEEIADALDHRSRKNG
ncbi:hypothetical protein F4X33_05120 [Candidatus Poribacteria bacterium]|nr:hypothetical protein [Candidatus Poribacteria bacterium]